MRGSVIAIGVLFGLGLACSGVPGGTCTIGETKCEGNTLSVCNVSSTWEVTMDCPTGTTCGVSSGIATCVPDAPDLGGGGGGGGGGGEGGGGGKAGKRKAKAGE